jgi:hypothetical protein
VRDGSASKHGIRKGQPKNISPVLHTLRTLVSAKRYMYDKEKEKKEKSVMGD